MFFSLVPNYCNRMPDSLAGISTFQQIAQMWVAQLGSSVAQLVVRAQVCCKAALNTILDLAKICRYITHLNLFTLHDKNLKIACLSRRHSSIFLIFSLFAVTRSSEWLRFSFFSLGGSLDITRHFRLSSF